jgi:hypothetical protein
MVLPYESFFSSIVMRSSFVPRAGTGLALSGVEGTHPKLERVCVPSRGEVNDQELVVQGGRGVFARTPPYQPPAWSLKRRDRLRGVTRQTCFAGFGSNRRPDQCPPDGGRFEEFLLPPSPLMGEGRGEGENFTLSPRRR